MTPVERASPSTAVTAATAAALCFVRLPLLALGFGLTALVLLAGDPELTFGGAWAQAADHAYVVVSIVADLPCLLLLACAMRREGGQLRDLLRDSPQSRRKTAWQGLMVFAIMAVPFAVLPPLATWIVGAQPYPPGLTTPPLWVALWTVAVFPFTTAPAEELIYRAYALPRLRRRFGVVAGIMITAVGFGATHLLIPPLGSPGTLVARFITLAIVGVCLELLFLRLKRIWPLVIGHLLVDMLLIGGFALSGAWGR